MSAIVVALGVVGNLWSALRSATPPHPLRSLSQEGGREREPPAAAAAAAVALLLLENPSFLNPIRKKLL
ncbi:unnamed protein product [Sphagnum jensenii]|uniref:Uncharacterized protein n=1 Tax=Sphagnum jensenii TaxID=128206 RepID=A0ABP1BC70_9BRYO